MYGCKDGGRRKPEEMLIIVRWADDFVLGFQYQDEAERFLKELRERFRTHSLELHRRKRVLSDLGALRRKLQAHRRTEQAGDFQLSGIHALLWYQQEWKVHGKASNDEDETYEKAP